MVLTKRVKAKLVLILVLMEDTLRVLDSGIDYVKVVCVLILVLMEDTLREHYSKHLMKDSSGS